MDNAVALVQAFLRLHGYLTVTEFPVVRRSSSGGYEAITDLDVLAFRFGGAKGACDGAPEHLSARLSLPDALLGARPGEADMIIGEVKEGRAELNAAATKSKVLVAALERFGCCPGSALPALVRTLLREGRAKTGHGHHVRLVAFGSVRPGGSSSQHHVVLLADVVAHLRAYIQTHWSAVQASASKDPGLGFLITLEKARRGEASSSQSELHHGR